MKYIPTQNIRECIGKCPYPDIRNTAWIELGDLKDEIVNLEKELNDYKAKYAQLVPGKH